MAHRRDHIPADAEPRNRVVAEHRFVVWIVFGGLNFFECFFQPPVSQREGLMSGELWTVLLLIKWSPCHHRRLDRSSRTTLACKGRLGQTAAGAYFQAAGVFLVKCGRRRFQAILLGT